MKPLHAARFLVVDDEPFSRSIVVRSLSSLGTKVTQTADAGRETLEVMANAAVHVGYSEPTILEAQDGQDAIQALKISGAKIDCVISDFQMPEMNGLALLQAIRCGQTPAPRDLPFAIVTGFAENQVIGAAMALHVNTFLAKPISPALLHTRLARIMEEEWEPGSIAHYTAVPIPGGLPPKKKEPPKPVKTETPPGTVKVALGAVAADSVLGADLYTEHGTIVMAKGAFLTARAITRLHDLVEMGHKFPEILIRA